MSDEARIEVLKRIESVVTLAGFRSAIDEENGRVRLGFDLGAGRAQTAYVTPVRTCNDGDVVIQILSPCLRLKKGWMKGMSKETALDLLRRNQRMPFARFGVLEWDSELLVVVSVDALLDSLDPDELGAHVGSVVETADAYEREQGLDEY